MLVIHDRPCKTPPDTLYECRVYLRDEIDPQVYVRVKHVFWGSGNTVLVIVQYDEDGTYRYINWLRERLTWYQVRRQGSFTTTEEQRR